jgi:hypothetical protein
MYEALGGMRMNRDAIAVATANGGREAPTAWFIG